MRLIGALNSEKKGLAFSRFLQRKGIANQIEVRTNTDWGSSEYGTTECQIWIGEEEQVPEAMKWYQFYLDHPEDPVFQQAEPLSPLADEEEQPELTPRRGVKGTASTWADKPMGWVTKWLLIICALLLVLTILTTPKADTEAEATVLSLYGSPVEKVLLYDYPELYALINRYYALYGTKGLSHPQEVAPEGQALLNKINQTPAWQGAYQLLLTKGKDQYFENQAPLFEKIRQGEIWRLFTPSLLHADIFHLFFNMIWLIVLGKQMEQRLKPARYLIFLLIVGIFSNTCQYLMTGPAFLGFSGILCGMLTFIWTRQKQAPWEGYQLNRSTYLFMLAFILGMASLQILSFFLEKSLSINFSINIANMAHLSGGLIGFGLGRMNFFRWRHS